MNPFWGGFFENFKDCGKRSWIFLVTFAAIAFLIPFLKTFEPDELKRFFACAGPAAALPAIFWFALAIRRARTRRNDRWKFSPLASDERRVARSKLKAAKAPSATKLPDTDLKY